MELDRRCMRCGKPELTDDQKEQVRLDLLLHDGKLQELPAPDEWLVDLTGGGYACWSCLTLEEQRRDQFQCERCGAQFYDDGRDSDSDWIVEPSRVICPACQTHEEAEAESLRFLEAVDRGIRIRASEGRGYPVDLLELAGDVRAGMEFRRHEAEDFDKRMGQPPEVG